AAAALAVGALLGCRKKHEEAPAPPAPVDHLAPGELAEGTLKAYGLTLPIGVIIVARNPDHIIAHGAVGREALSNYVRARVRDGNATVGAARTDFSRVRVPTDAQRLLDILVYDNLRGFTEIVVKDVTPPVLPQYKSDEERLRAAGLTPNGQIADPKHMQ